MQTVDTLASVRCCIGSGGPCLDSTTGALHLSTARSMLPQCNEMRAVHSYKSGISNDGLVASSQDDLVHARGVPQQVALSIAAESLAGAVALVGARASILVLLVKVAARALAPAAAVPAQRRHGKPEFCHAETVTKSVLRLLKSEVGLLVIIMSRTRTASPNR